LILFYGWKLSILAAAVMTRMADKKAEKKDGALSALVEAEKLIQLALLIPCATVVGWLAGVGLDRWLHQQWIYVVGLLFGAAAGFLQMFRTVLRSTKE
jgi:F0F1-type ATP synthase assembly protein I